MIEAGPDISFANCGLPYYIGGDIKDGYEVNKILSDESGMPF